MLKRWDLRSVEYSDRVMTTPMMYGSSATARGVRLCACGRASWLFAPALAFPPCPCWFALPALDSACYR